MSQIYFESKQHHAHSLRFTLNQCAVIYYIIFVCYFLFPMKKDEYAFLCYVVRHTRLAVRALSRSFLMDANQKVENKRLKINSLNLFFLKYSYYLVRFRPRFQ